ncbi:BTB POZ domain protein [Venturia nashicola]|uniref:BTB POZ domain protein n=1 Tax=Venturia nashicola TaxID=86259 RepID=A0A4Z1P645_9PEZI|nr:BTB POZ domain protein [Venturia nashicola]
MSSQGLKAAAMSCLDSGDHSDFTIKCNEREFKVHKMVLCPQSSFFAKAVQKYAFQEGQTGVIPMDHDDPDAIGSMLRFLYTGDYDTENLTMQAHLKIYALADKVDITALKTLSEDKFNAIANANWKDATFPACIRTAYEISPPGTEGDRLRSIVVDIAAKHITELARLDNGFRQTMEAVAEFGADLVETISGVRKSTFAIKPKGANYRCYNCDYKWSGEPTSSRSNFCPNCADFTMFVNSLSRSTTLDTDCH